MKLLQQSLILSTLLSLCSATYSLAQIDDAADLHTQQQQEKNELHDMKREIDAIKNNMQDALKDMSRVQSMVSGQQQVKEFHLQAKETTAEVFPGCFMSTAGYNNMIPGPNIRVSEGDSVKLVLHNGLKTPTSLYIQGMSLPHNVDGLPKTGAGLVGPGQTYVYQFVASQAGTFYYRPQVPHLDQMHKGMVGAIIVEPKSVPKTYERDQVIVLTEASAGDLKRSGNTAQQKQVSSGLLLCNGKSAQSIPPLELKNGERMRLRMINASQQPCPFSLTGHRLEIVSQNGSDPIEPHVFRDTVTIHPGERVDLEFSADNPGVWSLSSLNLSQCSFNGQFPGGFAMVVRYPEALK